MNQITFVPVGGLANRLRALASAVVLAQRSHSLLHVYWFRDWALNAPFSSLFLPVDTAFIHLHEASSTHLFTVDRPRRRNLYFPSLYQHLRFRSSIYEKSVHPLYEDHFDFVGWVEKYGKVYLASYVTFQPYEDALLRQLFVPVPEVMDEINRRSNSFPSHIIGVHVRRTDSAASINKSPLDAFYERIDACPGAPTIFLATDSDEVKRLMCERYGQRIITSSYTADRNSIAGIREGIIDMFLLSRTTRIFGSFWSTFSVMAAQIGGIPIEVIERG